ncbi:portal protein [Lysobacter capsici]|uniref:portal protein n=1 Tax=Lysobacter capsici TaxID=435897 RepID=UPI001C004DDB|nr:portal protein [Lysobacter capsici]QWF19293.1 hypothetical protein KME82_11410 [Lysobacter capsici]
MSNDNDKSTDAMMAMRERFSQSVSFDSTLRTAAVDDLRFGFIPGEQWDPRQRAVRQRAGRPCYEFNKVRQHSKQITNDLRQNRPQIKVKATKQGTAEAGKIMQGLIRSIEAASHADQAYDTAGFFATNAGFGVIRVTTEYADDDTFELDARIREVRNPFGIHFDPSAKETDKRDGRFAFVPDRISRKEFKERWPDAQPVSFQGCEVYGGPDWWGQDDIRICEYWERDPVKKRVVQLSDGRVIDGDKYDKIADELAQPQQLPDGTMSEPITKKSERVVDAWAVKVSIVSGNEVLEGPTPWPGKWIPLVPVWGDLVNIDGKEHWSGMIRPSKDAQRQYNFNRTSMIEIVAEQPKSPLLYTAAMVQGYEAVWEKMSEANAPALPYNFDPKAPGGRPMREQPPAFPSAMLQLAQIDSDDIKAVTGQHDPSMGVRKGQQSGRAIVALQREGDVANFDYSDNLSRGIRFVGEILVDVLPKIIDTERMVRILGPDDTESYVTINQQVFDDESQQWVTINDLSQAKYDVVCQAGPSYTTMRQEAADALMQLANGGGPAALLALYGALLNQDMPGIEPVLAGLKQLLVQNGLMKPDPKDEPEAPPPPNPKDVADAKYKDAQARKSNADAEQTQVETQMLLAQLPQLLQQLQMQQPSAGLPPGSPEDMPPPDQGDPSGPMFDEPPQGGFFMGEQNLDTPDWPQAADGPAFDPYPGSPGLNQ